MSIVSSVSAAPTIVYVPAEFPNVCAHDLSSDRPMCPAGVTERPEAFCGAGLSRLAEQARLFGVPLCGGAAASATSNSVELVLLVDDRGLDPALRQTIEPVVSATGRVNQASGLFRNRTGTVVRNMVIVGEGSSGLVEPGSELSQSGDSRIETTPGDSGANDETAGSLGESPSRGSDSPENEDLAEAVDPLSPARQRYLRGKEYYDDEQFPEALEEFLAAYALDPRPRLLFNAALALENMQRYSEAADNFARFLAEVPNARDAEETRRRIDLLRTQALEQEQLRALQLTNRDNVPEASDRSGPAQQRFDRGVELYTQERFPEALEEFQAVYTLASDSRPEILWNLAVTFERMQRYTEAADHFGRYLTEVPDYPDTNEVRRRIDLLRTMALEQAQLRALGLTNDGDSR
jgi:tetratricopeptide (TPR) repeat protein